MTSSREQGGWRDQLRSGSRLYLNDSNIGEDDAVLIADELKQNNSLVGLIMTGNAIGDRGAEALANALAVNSTLKHLFLDGNKIGKGGALAFAKALEKNKTLRLLLLARNRIDDSGAKALSVMLMANTTLQYLELEENNIGDYGALAFAEAIKVNSTLTGLQLGNNYIGDPGLVALEIGLRENAALEELCLINNNLGDYASLAMDNITSRLRLDPEDRFAQTVRRKLQQSTEKVSTIDCMAFPVPCPCGQFESWKARHLGESLQEHGGVTSLIIQIDATWDESAVANGGDLCPLLQYMEQNDSLSKLTYIVREHSVKLSVVQHFFEAVTDRSHAVQVALRVDVAWLVHCDCMKYLGQLVQDSQFASSLKHLFLTHESGLDFWIKKFDSEEFARNLHRMASLESLVLEIAEVWGALKISALTSTLQSLSVKIKDENTLLQIFDILPLQLHLQNLRMEMLGAAAIQAWKNREGECIQAFQRNCSLHRVQLVGDGEALELPAEIAAVLERNQTSGQVEAALTADLESMAQELCGGSEHRARQDDTNMPPRDSNHKMPSRNLTVAESADTADDGADDSEIMEGGADENAAATIKRLQQELYDAQTYLKKGRDKEIATLEEELENSDGAAITALKEENAGAEGTLPDKARFYIISKFSTLEEKVAEAYEVFVDCSKQWKDETDALENDSATAATEIQCLRSERDNAVEERQLLRARCAQAMQLLKEIMDSVEEERHRLQSMEERFVLDNPEQDKLCSTGLQPQLDALSSLADSLQAGLVKTLAVVGEQGQPQLKDLDSALQQIQEVNAKLETARSAIIALQEKKCANPSSTTELGTPHGQNNLAEDLTLQGDATCPENGPADLRDESTSKRAFRDETNDKVSSCVCVVWAKPKKNAEIVPESLKQNLYEAMKKKKVIPEEGDNPIIACRTEKNYFRVTFRTTKDSASALKLNQ